MLWLIYLFATIGLTLLLTISVSRQSNRYIIYSIFVLLITPAQIVLTANSYAPAFFSFLFNIILERDYSLRILRPIFLSLPLGLLLLWAVSSIKKKFF